MRPSSGSSTRSRRDEVWEQKRQQFLSKKAGGGGGAGGGRSRPPALGQEDPFQSSPQQLQVPAPSSPLSQLVNRGYAQPALNTGSAHQPYGDRPSSGSVQGGGFIPQNPGSGRGGQFGGPSGGGGGFNAATAGQWTENVQQTRNSQQNRHDPNVSGPGQHQGGQRITQAPGGGSNIDLSWGGPQAQQPPRMPGGTPGGSSVSSHRNQPGQAYDGSAAGSRGQQQQFASPWGRDDDNLPARQQQQQGRRDACPFGTDAHSAGSRMPQQQPAMPSGQRGGGFGGEAPASGHGHHGSSGMAGVFGGGSAEPEPRHGGQRGGGGGGGFGGHGQASPAGGGFGGHGQASPHGGGFGSGFSAGGEAGGGPSGGSLARYRQPPGGASQVVFG